MIRWLPVAGPQAAVLHAWRDRGRIPVCGQPGFMASLPWGAVRARCGRCRHVLAAEKAHRTRPK